MRYEDVPGEFNIASHFLDRNDPARHVRDDHPWKYRRRRPGHTAHRRLVSPASAECPDARLSRPLDYNPHTSIAATACLSGKYNSRLTTTSMIAIPKDQRRADTPLEARKSE